MSKQNCVHTSGTGERSEVILSANQEHVKQRVRTAEQLIAGSVRKHAVVS